VRSCRAEQANIDTLILSMTHLLSSSYFESRVELVQTERSVWETDFAYAKTKGGQE
jgi:hypothetical protein